MKTHQINAEHFRSEPAFHVMASSSAERKRLYAVMEYGMPALRFRVTTPTGETDFDTISEAVAAYNEGEKGAGE